MSTRPITVFEMAHTGRTYEKRLKCAHAKFHGFGVDYQEFEAGPGNYTAAIVEFHDGTVSMVPVHLIRFLDVQRRLAPWSDFAGQPVHEGDTIEHPTGQRGVVEFWPLELDDGDAWRVRYVDDPDHLSRLCLQLGDKGMAVVVKVPA